jgi:hypothetical protein
MSGTFNINQINVNVTDVIPPDNFATVDAGTKVGTVYTKEQDNAWRAEVEQNVTSGITGVAKPDDTVPATGFFRMLADTATIYTNYLGVNDAPIEVTDADLNIVNGVQRNEVIFEVTNGVAEKKVFAKVGADGANGTATIPKWVAGDYSPDAMVVDNFVQYIAPTGADATDVPGLSDKWVSMGGSEIGSNIDFRNKVSDKSMSSAQLFNEVIGDFNFPGVQTPVVMEKPEPNFAISNANQLLPYQIYWSPHDRFYDDMDFITSMDMYFLELSASFPIYIFDRNNNAAPVQTISVPPPTSGRSKNHVFDPPINNATHKVYVGNGMGFYAHSNANAVQAIENGTQVGNNTIVLGISFNGYKIDGAGSKKIVPRLEALENSASTNPEAIYVSKVPGGFNNINDAVNSIRNSTGRKTIYVQDGTYEEVVDLYAIDANLTIEIIGLGRNVKVLKRTGDYYAPPMQVNCNSYFENITFESTAELGVASPTSYAVHSDVNYTGSTPPALIEFRNCKFTNKALAQAFGAGSWQAATLRFRHCIFEKKNTLYNGGAMYWHNAVANAKLQRLEMFYCEMYSDAGPTIQLHDANQTHGANTNPALSEATVLFIGNTFYSGDTPANNSLLVQEVTRVQGAIAGNIFLDPRSHGNNISFLNY